VLPENKQSVKSVALPAFLASGEALLDKPSRFKGLLKGEESDG